MFLLVEILCLYINVSLRKTVVAMSISKPRARRKIYRHHCKLPLKIKCTLNQKKIYII